MRNSPPCLGSNAWRRKGVVKTVFNSPKAFKPSTSKGCSGEKVKRLSYTLKDPSSGEKGEKLRFRSFLSAVREKTETLKNGRKKKLCVHLEVDATWRTKNV